MEDEPTLICNFCSKPICGGTAVIRAGDGVAHVRCLVEQTGLRTLELQDQAARTVERAGRTVAEARKLARQARRRPGRFLVSARITAIDHAHRVLTLGPLTIRLADEIALDGLRVGMRVTIVGMATTGEQIGFQLMLDQDAPDGPPQATPQPLPASPPLAP